MTEPASLAAPAQPGEDAVSDADAARIAGIAERLAEGRMIPFLGSAASFAGVPASDALLPSGKGLASELAQKLGALYPGHQDDPLTVIAEYWAGAEYGRSDLYSFLENRFYVQQRDVDPNPTALLLADIDNLPLVVTTNYDPHLEIAFQRASRPYVVVSHVFKRGHEQFGTLLLSMSEAPTELKAVDATKGFTVTDFADRTIIYKMHGSVGPPLSEATNTVVITESDYVEFMSLPEQSRLPPTGFAEPFTRLPFVFLGYSLADWNFRVILRRLEASAELQRGEDDRRHFAVLRTVGPVERTFWARRNVTLITCSLETFVNGARSKLWPS